MSSDGYNQVMTYILKTAETPYLAQLEKGQWQQTVLPEHLGKGTNAICQIDDGLMVADTHYQFERDVAEECDFARKDRSLTMTIALTGVSSTVNRYGQSFDFVEGHSTLAAFSDIRGIRQFSAQKELRQIRLVAEESFLQRYQLEGLLERKVSSCRAELIHFGKYSHATRQLAQSLIHLRKQKGSLLNLQIVALSLLADQTYHLLAPKTSKRALKERDQEKIYQVKELLCRHYAEALTIPYLCATVGINEFKLKQGFRELFNTTPHQMLMDIRMKKAWELLESGCHVSTTAYRVGYQHLSSFSVAFKNYYGLTAKSVMA